MSGHTWCGFSCGLMDGTVPAPKGPAPLPGPRAGKSRGMTAIARRLSAFRGRWLRAGPASHEPGLAGRPAMVNTSKLGYVQRRALHRLAGSAAGLTTADMEDISDAFTPSGRRSCLANAMRLLKGRGLVTATGKVPPASVNGRGERRYVWEPTDEGRALAGRTR